jgi:hypothetical protein
MFLNGARRVRPGLEELELRDLPSVTVTPPVLNLKSAVNGRGAFRVLVLSDTATAAAVLGGTNLTITVTDANGKEITLGDPERSRSFDRNGEGILDRQLKFRRSELKGLAAGTATVAVKSSATDPTTGETQSETTTIFLFLPGRRGPGGRGIGIGNGNGHGKGGSGPG